MTPSARLSAAISILDLFLAGEAAEKALTSWARGARYAGSKDRAAVRDVVFDVLRRLRSYAALGGAMTGRGLVLGALRANGGYQGAEEAEHFTGNGHAPDLLSDAERNAGHEPIGDEALDCPEWIAPQLKASLGDDYEPVLKALRHRAPVFLRVNLRKTSVNAAMEELAADGIETQQHPLSKTALEVVSGARRVQLSEVYTKGFVELQDAASQAVVDLLPLPEGGRVLDYCAGGGGKTLAMAGRCDADFFAHDAAPQRMRNLPERAARAGVKVVCLDDPGQAEPFDLVLCDAPCSGSGSWRRSPEGKWRLNREKLDQLCDIQKKILKKASNFVRRGGTLAYVTCSLLDVENIERIEMFLSHEGGFRLVKQRRFTPLEGGDGFYISVLTHEV